MLQRSSLNSIILTVALVLGGYAVLASSRAGELAPKAETPALRPEAGAVANVDMQKVFEGSAARKAAEDRIRAYSEKVSGHYDEISKLAYLDAEEVSAVSAAMNADNPTAADQKKITDIKAANSARESEAQTLNSKKDTELTDAERKRIRDLAGLQQQRGSILQQLGRVYQDAVNVDEAKELRVAMGEVRVIVSKIAKEQGLTQVYDTSAMVYAPNDLTDAAIKRAAPKAAKP